MEISAPWDSLFHATSPVIRRALAHELSTPTQLFNNQGRFRCVACGRSPATHMDFELHADHIVSVYDGGKATFENLQTLIWGKVERPFAELTPQVCRPNFRLRAWIVRLLILCRKGDGI